MSYSDLLRSVSMDLPESYDLADSAMSDGAVAIKLADGSMKTVTKTGYTLHVSEENLELFGRKVEEKLQESIRNQLEPDNIPYESLVDLIVTEDPTIANFKEQVTDGDPDYYLGVLKDKAGQFHAAEEHFLLSANRGNIKSKYVLALYYYNGDLGYTNFEKSYTFLKDFVDSNHDGALYLLSQFYYDGLGGCPKDPQKSFEFSERSAALGNNDGKIMLASYYHHGQAIKKNHEKAFALLKEIYDSQHISGAMFQLLGMYYLGLYGVEKKDATKAFELFTKAADIQYASAYFPLGMMYFEGVDIKQDYKKAFSLFQKASLDNHPESHMYIAHCYYFGLGVAADKERARAIMRLYLSARYPESFYHLGCFAQAEGEYDVAFIYFQNALKADDKRAYGPLSISHFLGQGTEVNYKKAFDLLRKVVFFTPQTFLYLSLCHSEGKGTSVNFKAAIVALERSVKMWPDAETHHKLAFLYLTTPMIKFAPVDCENILLHFSGFLELNQNQDDPRVPIVYYWLASFKRIQFRLFNNSLDVLNDSVRFAREAIDRGFQNPVFLKNCHAEFKSSLKQELSISIEEREKNFNELSALDFVQVMRYDIYMQKPYFDHYLDHPEEENDKHRYKHLKAIHAFLYEDLDREWGLLRRDQMRKLLKLNAKLASFLVVQVNKVFYGTDLDALKTEKSSTPEEVADSFMPIIPKKKTKAAAKPKASQKNAGPKKVPAPQQKESSPKSIPQPANQNRAPVIISEVKSISPPKASAPKDSAPAPSMQSREVKRVQKMLSIAQSFKAAQEAIITYYSKDVSSSLRKSIESVFDKKSLSQDKVIGVMEHLADTEKGSCAKNGNGGARLIVGDLSVGCHAFHGPGDKNHLGFIAELRKLMVALYQKKQ